MAEIVVTCPECKLQAKVLPREDQVAREPAELPEPKTLALQSPSGIAGEPVPCDQALASPGPLRTASTAVILENKQPDCGRKIELEALAALTVEGRNEAADRSSLSGSNFLERIPKGVL